MATELIIFDCDGVLVDSERLCVRVESELLTEMGWPITVPEVIERFVGRSDSYMHAEIEAALGRAVPEWPDLTLGLTGLYDRFVGRIFSATEVANGKPAPDVFLHAAERMGVDPMNCVVVEDSPSGVEAAHAAGMRCIAYAAGLVPVERLRGTGATIIDDMAELPGALATLVEVDLADARRPGADDGRVPQGGRPRLTIERVSPPGVRR